jgi:hypothetical protein
MRKETGRKQDGITEVNSLLYVIAAFKIVFLFLYAFLEI